MKLQEFELLVCKPNSGMRELFTTFDETPEGYVKLKHLEKYHLALRNNSHSKVSAKVSIDGKNIGTFIINKKSHLNLETVPGSGKQFIFIASGTTEGLITVDDIPASDRGLIRVDFQKEKEVVKLESYETYQTKDNVSRSFTRSGGTGLSGESYQSFKSVDFTADDSETWTIYIRLIQDKEVKQHSTSFPTPLED